MSTPTTLHVPAMSCGHCVATIRKTLQGLGVSDVQVDLKAKEVRLGTQACDLPGVLAALEAEGYPATAA